MNERMPGVLPKQEAAAGQELLADSIEKTPEISGPEHHEEPLPPDAAEIERTASREEAQRLSSEIQRAVAPEKATPADTITRSGDTVALQNFLKKHDAVMSPRLAETFLAAERDSREKQLNSLMHPKDTGVTGAPERFGFGASTGPDGEPIIVSQYIERDMKHPETPVGENARKIWTRERTETDENGFPIAVQQPKAFNRESVIASTGRKYAEKARKWVLGGGGVAAAGTIPASLILGGGAEYFLATTAVVAPVAVGIVALGYAALKFYQKAQERKAATAFDALAVKLPDLGNVAKRIYPELAGSNHIMPSGEIERKETRS